MTKRKITILIVVLAAAVVALVLGTPHSRVVYQDERVLVTSETSMIGLLAVHHSPTIKAEVFGKTFAGIRGTAPFYLEIKPLSAILLVQEDAQGKVTFVVAYDETKKIVTIRAGRLGFGWNIGSQRAPGDTLTDYVESADHATITLLTQGMGWKETIELDLVASTVRNVKSEAAPRK